MRNGFAAEDTPQAMDTIGHDEESTYVTEGTFECQGIFEGTYMSRLLLQELKQDTYLPR